MTDLMPDAVLATVRGERGVNPRKLGPEPGSTCTSANHGRSQHAWTRGCRCPSALAAHQVWLREKARWLPPALDADGNCIAEGHGPSKYAYRRGCRCPETVVLGQADRRNKRARARHNALARRANKPTPPPAIPCDSRRVSRVNLVLLLSGFVDSPTPGERLAAVIILSGRGDRNEAGTLTGIEIADRVGVDARAGLGKYHRMREQLRSERAARRLADVREKAARVQRATSSAPNLSAVDRG